MDIDVDIDAVVIDGLPLNRAQRAEVDESVRDELARLLAGGGAVPTSSTAQRTAPDISYGPDDSPRGIGRKLAHSIYEGISHD